MLTTKNASTVLLILGTATVSAQQAAPTKECDDNWGRSGSRGHVCEVRELIVRAPDTLSVESTTNGGIRVAGEDRKDVLVRAMVNAWAGDENAARTLASEVVVHTTDGVIRAEGPSGYGRTGWGVSYEILAPRDTDLKLETNNGGIEISNVRGDMSVETTNGGIRLDGLAGNVRGRATNGGVDITLTGARWDGETLDVRTTNGGVRLRVPEKYSARLEAGTVHGAVSIDFPVTVQGRIGREITATLGDGGPLVRAETTNGGVRVSQY
jgi:DUF4097 and DUF4098 domain-containing protein YvlB